MLHNKTEKLIYEFILAGALDDSVLSALVPDGKFYDFESWVFDYKAGYHLSQEPKSPELELAEPIKDFVAFVTLLNDNDDLLRRLAAYAGAAISIRIFRSKININEIAHNSLCIFVPKRPPRSKLVAFAKNSPNKGDTKSPAFVFKKNDIYVRREFECVLANNDLELLSFAFSDRSEVSLLALPNTIENNLPLKDPNLIRFVGRKSYLRICGRGWPISAARLG